MGVYVADSDSEQFDEKTQTTTAPKQSYCPFILFRQYRRGRQEKRDQESRTKIENIREKVNKSRKKLQKLQETSWHRATSTEQRRQAFERGVEAGSFYNRGTTYKKGWVYKLTWTGARGKRIVIHDLCGAKGCDEAFEWWDQDHALQRHAIAYYISKCDSWEARYKEYVKKLDSNLRDSLLGGDPTRWSNLKVEVFVERSSSLPTCPGA